MTLSGPTRLGIHGDSSAYLFLLQNHSTADDVSDERMERLELIQNGCSDQLRVSSLTCHWRSSPDRLMSVAGDALY